MGLSDFIDDLSTVRARRKSWQAYARRATDAGIQAPPADAQPLIPPPPVPETRQLPATGASWIAVASFLALGGTLLALLFLDNIVQSPSLFVRLPLQIVLGSIAFLTGITFIVVVFVRLNLQDRAHALGLPDGSIRALIALILIVIFFIFANSVYGTVQGQDIIGYSNLTGEQIETLDGDVLERTPSGTNENDVPVFNGRIRTARVSDDGIALGQQLVTALITLVAAISAFYFGSNSVRTATDTATRIAAAAGTGGDTAVPKVVGMTSAVAQFKLNQVGLLPSETGAASDDVAAGLVVSQDPEAGASAKRGDAVLVVVSSGPAAPAPAGGEVAQPILAPDDGDGDDGDGA